MTRKAAKPKSRAKGVRKAPTLDPLRAGMPAPDSITEVKQIERGGKVYRIIKTDEADEYDPPRGEGRGRKR